MAREDKVRDADRSFGKTRLGDAQAYLQQAELSLELVDGPRRAAAAVSSAVLAGIAAADAACVVALGRYSAGSHDQSARLLRGVHGASKASSDLSRLIASKTASQYAGGSLTDADADAAIERARRLLAFAEQLFR